jgi:RHS repeat-associated protein
VTQAGSTSYGYDANGNMTSRGGSSISYTSYNLPSLINAGSETSALHYGAFRNRFKQVTAGASPETRIYVAGLMEKVTRGGVTEYRYQIGGPTGTVAIYTRRTDGSTPTYYLLRDHLGSPELITNTAGVPTVKLSFSAYGERRGSNWSGTPSGGEWNAIAFTTRDGFTEHEHLDNVGLVHMNGRVYDPRIGRFLSKDPIVHMGLSQSPNSYSYVWNNPLRWVDPSGASPETLQIPQLTQDGGHGGVIPGSTFVGGERTTATLSGVIVTATSLANSGRPPGVIPSVGVALNRGPPTRHGGGGGGTRSGGGGDTPSPEPPTPEPEKEPQQEFSPTCRAISDALGGAVAGTTFAVLTGQGAVALHYAGAFGAIAGITSLLAPSGGFGAFTVAGHVGAVALARGGSSGGSFADVMGVAVEAATPFGPATIPVGSATGAVASAIQPLHLLGRASSAIVGGSAGGLAAATGLATSAAVSAAFGCLE